MGTITDNSGTVSSTSIHARARYLTATANSSSLFFPIVKRLGVHDNNKARPIYFISLLICLSALKENTTTTQQQIKGN